MLIFLVSMLYALLLVETEEDTDKVSHFLPHNIGGFYMFIFGDGPFGDHEMTASLWTLQLIFTFVVNIIAMNLLIAILSNTFDNV